MTKKIFYVNRSVCNGNTPGYNFSFNFCYSLASVNSKQTIYLIIKNNYKLDSNKNYSKLFNIKKINNLLYEKKSREID